MRGTLLLLIVLLSLNASAQAVTSPDSTTIPDSENGWYLSPHGTIRILVLFAEVEYDLHPDKDPAPGGGAEWRKGELPTWKDNVFDPFALDQPKAMVSQYYHQMSLGNFTVLGDYVDQLVVVKESEQKNLRDYSGMVWTQANKAGVLHTAHDLSVSDFDLWRDGGRPGMPKVGGADSPHSYDHVMVILRNSPLPDGNGSTDAGSSGMLFGYQSDTQSRFSTSSSLPFGILKHEFNHLLLGGNNFHSGGGNAPNFTSYFIPLQGGWSMMGAANSSLLTACAWDRDRLGWYTKGSVNKIHTVDLLGHEMNGDIDPMAGDTGLFVLRDFVTTGDALHIRLPYIPEDEYPQWLWLENHQTEPNNECATDRFQYEYIACVKKAVPGIYAMVQVDRAKKKGADIYGGYADYLRPLGANGNYDLFLRGDTITFKCLWPGPTQPYFLRDAYANPLTGSQDLEFPLTDRNNDGTISRGEMFARKVEINNGKELDEAIFLGNTRQAFTPQGNHKIGMGTNPSSANMLSLVCDKTRETLTAGKPNNRTVRLNGISVELLEQRADGGILVHVRTGDVRLDQDVRWCADSIVLPPLAGPDGRSMIVGTKCKVVLDRSATPTRMVAQGAERGKTWFSPPTRFTVLAGADVLLEKKAVLELKNGSVLHVMSGSKVTFAAKAKLRVGKGCHVVLHGNGQLTAKECGLRKLRKQGRLITVAE
ncbi:MAG: hypothetical protein IPN44_12955 [Flavobacteriales bacterium]|nr:hypothetical protein [Flavobacteriales bacterium]